MPNPRPSSDDQERLYPAIANAVLKSVPEDWQEVLLRMEADESGQIQLEISGPAGAPNLRMPDDSLYEPAIELYELFARDAHPFMRCDFSLKWDRERESWRFKADYVYQGMNS